MAQNQMQVPLPPVAREEEEERRGGGFFFWLNSMPVRIAFVTAAAMLAFLIGRDFIFDRQTGNPRLDATREEAVREGSPTNGGLAGETSNIDDPFGLGDRPPPALPAESSGLVGSVSTGGLKKGRRAWGGLRPERETQRSSARLDGRAKADENGDPVVAPVQGREVPGGSLRGNIASGGGDGEGVGVGRMNDKQRGTKSIMRGWAWKDGKGGTKVELGRSGALDKLKAMEASMKAYGGRNATSAGSAHKKMWDAASYTDWKLQTQTSKGQSSVRDYKIGGKAVARAPILDEGEGGPLAAAAAAEKRRKTDGAGKTFTTDQAPEEEFQSQTGPAAGGELLPLASQALLSATGLNAQDLPDDIDAAKALGAAQAGGLLGLSGVGMMATGQTVQGASLMGLGALIEAQRRGP